MLSIRTYLPTDLELRSDGRTVVGLAAPFDAPAPINEHGRSFSEIIRRGAFARTISERGAAKVKLLALHDYGAMPLGRASLLREDAAGLYVEGRISQTAAGDEALELIRDGALDAFSIGFTVTRDGERWTNRDTVRELTDVKLHEISLTPFPAYAGALVSGLRSAAPAPHDPELDPEYLLRRLALNTPRRTFR